MFQILFFVSTFGYKINILSSLEKYAKLARSATSGAPKRHPVARPASNLPTKSGGTAVHPVNNGGRTCGKTRAHRGLHRDRVFVRLRVRRLRRRTRLPTNSSAARPDMLMAVSRAHSMMVCTRNRISSIRLMVDETCAD
jgi:hypothetical protein